MAKRDDSAEKPAQERHWGRMGCLVIFGVFSLVIVGIVFAPDQIPESTAPTTLSPTRTLARSTNSLTPPLSPTNERTVLPSPARTFPPTLTSLPPPTPLPSITRATPVTEEVTAAADASTSTQARTPISTPLATRTESPPLFTTNTPYPLLIVTNTPISAED